MCGELRELVAVSVGHHAVLTCSPEMVEEQVVEIEGGRHPVIDQLLEGGQFVANDTNLSVSIYHVSSHVMCCLVHM